MSRVILKRLCTPRVITTVTAAHYSLSSTFFSPKMLTAWPTHPHSPSADAWPYKGADFDRYDERPDTEFYAQPRIHVQHIDDDAIATLKRYYSDVLPVKGRILDLCSSWTSHFPEDMVERIEQGDVQVTGVGLNKAELNANPHLSSRIVNDLNTTAAFPVPESDIPFDAATCVVSIDYLTQPLSTLQHVRHHLKPKAVVHLVISDRRFATKAISIWERSTKKERLQIVGDYLHFAGFEKVEVVDLCEFEGKDEKWRFGEGPSDWERRRDPLWVVRGTNPGN